MTKKKTTKRKKAAKKASPKKRRGKPKKRETIKNHVFQLFKDMGKKDIKPGDVEHEQIIQKVKERFPNSKFDRKHLAWYLNKFRKA